jgi:hypothetical protein
MMIQTWTQYAADPATNWSLLRELKKSTLHYEHAREHGRPDTPRFAKGRLAHTLVFEPDFAVDAYAIFEGAARKGKAWKEFKAANADKTILKRSEYDPIARLADKVRDHFLVRQYNATGIAEQTIKWKDPETGIECKARIDWTSGEPVFLELKTCRSADEYAFGSACASLSYHGQCAFYRRGLKANGMDKEPIIVAAELEPPHDIALFRMSEHGALAVGDELVGKLLRKLADYRDLGVAGGRYEEERELILPRWCYPDDDGELTATIVENPAEDNDDNEEEAA